MDIKPSDGGGIIGTPLEPEFGRSRGARSAFKMTPADKIAPTKVIYERTRERDAYQNERRLMVDAAIEEAGPSNLYEGTRNRKQPLTLEDIMDEDDRAQLNLRSRTKGKRAERQVNAKQEGLPSVPFAVAASTVPEIVPKALTTSVGYAILRECRKQSNTATKKSRFKDLRGESHDQYRLAQHLSCAYLNKSDTKGLGYEENANSATAVQETKVLRKGGKLVVVKGRLDVEKECYEDGDFDDLANAGYNDLDAAADRMRRSMLKQRREASEKAKKEQKRSMHIAGLDDSDKILFAGFEKRDTLKEERSPDDPQLAVPPEFRANPVHNFENDAFRARSRTLPDVLQKEHDMLMKRQQEILSSEMRSVNMSIATAKRKKEEKLRVIRQQFLEDMSSNFVPAQGESDLGQAKRSTSGDKDKDDGNKKANPQKQALSTIGSSNRSVRDWVPCPLLCKRFGLEVPKATMSKEERVVGDKSALSRDSQYSSDEDDEFQVHAIVGADGRRIDFRNAGKALVEDDAVVLTMAETEKVLGGQRTHIRPSVELYRAIFNGDSSQGRVADKRDNGPNASETREQTDEAPKRGRHKTKAVDFF